MRRRPPQIVVTTPESLYVLLGSESGRKMLSTTRDGDRRRNPRAGPEQARQPPRAVARAARRADARQAARAHRPVGDAEADRRSRALSHGHVRVAPAIARSSTSDTCASATWHSKSRPRRSKRSCRAKSGSRCTRGSRRSRRSTARRSSSSTRGAWRSASRGTCPS